MCDGGLLCDTTGHVVGQVVGVLLPQILAHRPDGGEDGAGGLQLAAGQLQPLRHVQVDVRGRRTLPTIKDNKHAPHQHLFRCVYWKMRNR